MLKILCLHGFTQNAELFRSKTGALRQELKSVAELQYVDAPHVLPKRSDKPRVDAQGQVVEIVRRTWWFSGSRPQFDVEYPGFQESVDFLMAVLGDQGPFDGILGFSQGAWLLVSSCFTELLC
jgi:predicted esterase